MTVLNEITYERCNQDAKWGKQHHPNGTGSDKQKALANRARMLCERHDQEGTKTWTDILLEEVSEALAESDPRAELIQVAAVAVAWVEDIDASI